MNLGLQLILWGSNFGLGYGLSRWLAADTGFDRRFGRDMVLLFGTVSVAAILVGLA